MPASLDAMHGRDGIVYARGGALAPWDFQDDEGRPKRVNINPYLSMDDVQAIAAAAIAGYGLARLPSWLLARYVKSGELALVKGRCSLPPLEINVVWPQTRYMASKVRCAIDALVVEIPALIDE
jgi:DNA-binding transcriptional LysR family regulator